MIGDYFESPLAKPLLHTWSLAVEEQFYFVFPVLILIARARRSWAMAALVIGSALSLGVGFYISGISAKTAFFMLPTRVWEFGAGMAAAWLFRRDIVPKALATPAADAGFIIIIISFLAFDGTTGFPGWQSIMAVGGSAMLLTCQNARTLSSNLLKAECVQYAGRISYSWYLWHWPPLALWFVVTGAPATGGQAFALAFIGLMAGIGSFRYVERPITRLTVRPAQAVVVVAAFCAFALGASSIAFATGGFVRRYTPEAEKLMRAQLDVPPYRCPHMRRFAMWRDEVCQLNDVGGKGGVLLIGDSHADRTKTVLIELADAASVPLYLAKRNCRLSDYGVRSDCVIASVVSSIKNLGVRRVVAISHWDNRVSDDDRTRLLSNIQALGVPVDFQLPTPSGPFFDPAVRLRGKITVPRPTRSSIEQQTSAIRSIMSSQEAARRGVTVIDPLPVLCPSDCLSEVGGKHIYRDENHLTIEGVDLLKPNYASIFSKVRKQ
jgi:hypothetical protein